MTPRNWKFWSTIWPPERVILDDFQSQKSNFLDFFKVVLDLFRKCLGIVFGHKGPTFGCIVHSLSPITASLLWGPAKPYKTSTRLPTGSLFLLLFYDRILLSFFDFVFCYSFLFFIFHFLLSFFHFSVFLFRFRF